MKMLFISILMALSNLSIAANQIDLPTVPYVELERYLGDWYEIARFEQKFQKGCTAVKANYSMRKDGDIKVTNTCRLGSPQGKLKKGIARAWVVDKQTNAKLKVQFFLNRFRIPAFAGNYWILDLGADYEYALVGDKSRDYLWILSRTKTMDPGLYTDLVNKAKDLNFDVSKLIKTQH